MPVLVGKVVENLIVKELISYHADKVVRSKELFGCLALTIHVCLNLMSKFLVQECEVGKQITHKKEPG